MVLSFTTEQIKGHGNSLTKNGNIEVLLAAEKANEVITVQTDKVQFKYPLNGRDPRASLSLITADETIAAVKSAADVTATPYDADTETFPVLDVTGGAATDTLFAWKDFVYAITADATAGESWVWFNEGGFKVKKVLVDLTLAEIVILATP